MIKSGINRIEKESFFKLLINYGIIAMIFAVPLVFARISHPELVKVVFAEIIIWTLFVVWLCRCVETKDFSSRYTPLNKPILAFLAAVVISFIFSRYPSISVIDTMKFSSYAILFFLVVNFIDSEKKFNRIIKSLMLVTLVACIYGFLQRYQFEWVVRWITERTSSTLGNPNFFAAFLIMMLPIALYLYFRKQKFISNVFYFILIVLIFGSLVYTFSRSAWIGSFVSIVFLCISDLRYFLKKKAKIFFVLLLVILFVWKGSTYVETEYNNLSVLERVKGSFEPIHIEQIIKEVTKEEKIIMGSKKPFVDTVFDASRRMHYDISARIFSDNMITGTGPGTYGFMLPDYIKTKTLLDLYYRPKTVHAHNEYLQIMAEMGFLGIAAFLWILLVFFYSSYRIAINSRKNPEKRNLTIALTAGIIAVLIQNIFSVSLRYPAVTVFFWLLMGLVFASENSGKGHAKKAVIIKLMSVLVAAVLICFSVFLVIGSRVLLSEIYYTYAISDEEFYRAIELNPYSTDPYIMLAVRARKASNPYLMIHALKELNKTVPDYFVVNYHLGLAYYQIGDYEKAVYEFSKIRNPFVREYWYVSAYYRNKFNITPDQEMVIDVWVNE